MLYCRHFLTIHFNFNLENTDTIMEQTLGGETASLKPPLTSGLKTKILFLAVPRIHANDFGVGFLTPTQVHTTFLHYVSLLKRVHISNTVL